MKPTPVVQKSEKKQARTRNGRKQNASLFRLHLPTQATPGEEFVVRIAHTLPKRLGTQKIHVTLKDAGNKRVERIIKEVVGSGELRMSFQIPKRHSSNAYSISAFVGSEYSTNLLHRTEGPIKVAHVDTVNTVRD